MAEDALPELVATVLDSPEPISLARFYGALTGWTVYEDDPTWARVRPEHGPGLSFQLEEHWVRPEWPATGGSEQRMMSHLDFLVHDLEASVDRAESLGATQARHQPQEDVRVMLDPDGHPFCLFLPGA